MKGKNIKGEGNGTGQRDDTHPPIIFFFFNFQLSVFPEGKFHILAGFAHMTAKVDPQKP